MIKVPTSEDFQPVGTTLEDKPALHTDLSYPSKRVSIIKRSSKGSLQSFDNAFSSIRDKINKQQHNDDIQHTIQQNYDPNIKINQFEVKDTHGSSEHSDIIEPSQEDEILINKNTAYDKVEMYGTQYKEKDKSLNLHPTQSLKFNIKNINIQSPIVFDNKPEKVADASPVYETSIEVKPHNFKDQVNQ